GGDADLPAAGVPARQRIAIADDVAAGLPELGREEIDERRVRGVARVLRTEPGHPDLLVPDVLLRRQQIRAESCRAVRSACGGASAYGIRRGRGRDGGSPFQERAARKSQRRRIVM